MSGGFRKRGNQGPRDSKGRYAKWQAHQEDALTYTQITLDLDRFTSDRSDMPDVDVDFVMGAEEFAFEHPGLVAHIPGSADLAARYVASQRSEIQHLVWQPEDTLASRANDVRVAWRRLVWAFWGDSPLWTVLRLAVAAVIGLIAGYLTIGGLW